MQVPEHVRAAFQLDGSPEPVPALWGEAVRYGRVVVSPAAASAAVSGKLREKLAGAAPGLRVSRPVRATDGRLTVGGFSATEFVPGSPAARIDEVVAGALLFDDCLANLDAPTAPPQSPDPWVEADREVFAGLRANGPQSVACLDFLARCVFEGINPPALVGLTPSAGPRPVGYTAALVIVDGLLANAVDPRVVQRWSHISHLRELCGLAVRTREIGLSGEASNVSSEFRRVKEILSV